MLSRGPIGNNDIRYISILASYLSITLLLPKFKISWPLISQLITTFLLNTTFLAPQNLIVLFILKAEPEHISSICNKCALLELSIKFTHITCIHK